MPSLHDVAVDFLQRVAAGQARAAFERYVAADFRHHNLHFAGDAASLMTAMEANAREFPEKRLTVHQVITEGDRVVVLSHVRHIPTEPGFALVHIFRFQSDRIVELWDLAQPIPPNSPNEHGPF
ncbi:MAG: nuclear transport factor 2 family protein [Armatimonadetes bacterium]|nr:nuclear transport factor 2 family protein [Armatimonadota bacterium]